MAAIACQMSDSTTSHQFQELGDEVPLHSFEQLWANQSILFFSSVFKMKTQKLNVENKNGNTNRKSTPKEKGLLSNKIECQLTFKSNPTQSPTANSKTFKVKNKMIMGGKTQTWFKMEDDLDDISTWVSESKTVDSSCKLLYMPIGIDIS